jgi:hypothetical protein
MPAFAMMVSIRQQANVITGTPKKRGYGACPLVASGNPAHRNAACTTTDKPRPHHRLVTLAASTSSRRSSSTSP